MNFALMCVLSTHEIKKTNELSKVKEDKEGSQALLINNMYVLKELI